MLLRRLPLFNHYLAASVTIKHLRDDVLERIKRSAREVTSIR
ncbi:hypothetical protein HMPREF1585_00369 [Gardnerella vaginalis JCP8481B]|nr:hypothetical protein HMPREF1585_00369 [Gardnerella vaginalis JCP8481B]